MAGDASVYLCVSLNFRCFQITVYGMPLPLYLKTINVDRGWFDIFVVYPYGKLIYAWYLAKKKSWFGVELCPPVFVSVLWYMKVMLFLLC